MSRPFLRLTSVAMFAMLASCGDTQQWQDEEDASLCEYSFRRDRNWARIPSSSPQAVELERLFLAGRPREPADNLAPAHPVWFSRAKQGNFASCLRTRCDAKLCYFHVQIYSQDAGQWKVSSEYDLAPRRAD